MISGAVSRHHDLPPFNLNPNLNLNRISDIGTSARAKGKIKRKIKIKRCDASTMNTVEKQPEPPPKPDIEDAWLTAPRFAAILGLLIFATFPGVLLGKTTFVVRDYGMFWFFLVFFPHQVFFPGYGPLL